MSLQLAAQHLAQHGRGDDKMLVHMTPKEVSGLQQLAQMHGGSLTRNPHTGLPEAGFLDSLMPTIIGAAAMYFTGGAAAPLIEGLSNAAVIGGGVGLAEAARTGSLSKGLMAGLGAYGGAGLAGGMMAGAGQQLAGESLAAEAANNPDLVSSVKPLSAADYARTASAQDIAAATKNVSGFDLAKAGFRNLTNEGGFSNLVNNMGGGMSLAKTGLAAMSPIIADQMVQTTTALPTSKSAIHPFMYDPGGGYTRLNSISPAENFKGFATGGIADDNSQSMFNYAHMQPAVDMHSGIGAIPQNMARGGVAHFDDGGNINSDYTPQQIADYISQNNLSGDSLAAAEQQFGVTPEQVSYAQAQAAPQSLPPDVVQIDPSAVNNQPTPQPTPDRMYYTDDSGNYNDSSGNFIDVSNTPGPNNIVGGGEGFKAPASIDAALAAYQAGDYGQAAQLLGASGMSAQDVVSKYGLSAADAANVAQNLGYTGDMSNINYYTPPPAAATTTGDSPEINTTPRADLAPAVAADAPTYTNYTPDQIAQYVQTSGINLNDPAAIAAAEKQTNIDPAAYNAWFASNANPFSAAALTNPANATAANVSAFDATLGTAPANMGINNAIATAYKNTGATENLAGNIQGNTQLAKEMDTWNVPPAQMAKTTGYTEAEIQALYDAVDPHGKFASAVTKTVTPAPASTLSGMGTTTTPNGTVLNTYTAPGSTTPIILNPVNRTTENVNTPTDIATAPAGALASGVGGNNATVNPNGTISQHPNIPGIPVGGFTGVSSLTNAYTAGGGHTGPTNLYVPKTVEELNAKYPVSGGSKQMLDYLSGKTTENPILHPYTPTGQISKDYASSVAGYPEKDTSQRMYTFDTATKKYIRNPDFIPHNFDPKTGEKVYGKSLNQIRGDMNTLKNDSDWLNYMNTNNIQPQQIADATGVSLGEVLQHIQTAKAGSGVGTTSGSGVGATSGSATNLPGGVTGTPLAAYPGYYMANGKYYDSKGNLVANNDNELQSILNPVVGANGGIMHAAMGGAMYSSGGIGDLGSYSDGGRLLRGPGDGVSDSIPATIGQGRPARLADGEFVVPARIVSELGNGSTEAGARKLYAMMDRVQNTRGKTIGKGKVATNTRADKFLPA